MGTTTGSELIRTVIARAGEVDALRNVYTLEALRSAAEAYNRDHDRERDGFLTVEGTELVATIPSGRMAQTPAIRVPIARDCPLGVKGCTVDALGYHRRADGSLGIHEGAIPLTEEVRPGETLTEAIARKGNLALLEEGSGERRHERLLGSVSDTACTGDDFDAPRLAPRLDDSIPNPAREVIPNPEFGPRRISDPLLRPIFTGDRRDPRDFGDGPFERPIPRDWNDRAPRPSGLSILLLALFRGGLGLAFLAALLLLAAKLSGFTKVLGLEGAPGRSGAISEPPVPSPLPTRGTSSGAVPRAASGGLALMALLPLGMAFGGNRSGDTSVVRGKTRSTSARDAVIRECRSEGCDQKIVFLRYTKRDGSETRLPINLTAEAERRARADEPWEPNNPDLISHHSTCPFAEDWRKKRGGTGAPARGRR